MTLATQLLSEWQVWVKLDRIDDVETCPLHLRSLQDAAMRSSALRASEHDGASRHAALGIDLQL
jgi:hypothetical protein